MKLIVSLLITLLLFFLSINSPIRKLILFTLIITLVSFFFLFLDFYFIGLTYLIVYIGAITILFLFVLMMIDLHSLPIIKDSLNMATKSVSITNLGRIILILLLTLISIDQFNSNELINSSIIDWSNDWNMYTDINLLSISIYKNYPLMILITGLILLILLIGIINIIQNC